MKRAERMALILDYFQKEQPAPQTELHYRDAYQLLVAVILSAQCTDKRVNQTTPAFFQRFPNAAELARAQPAEVYDLIKSISYPNSKSRHLIGMARMLMERFDGQVPLSVKDLMTLPGVGRKTANVIVSCLDQQPALAVDTHVFRVAKRLGLTRNARTPYQAEKQLVRLIPVHLISRAHHWLILHGRYVCVARKPRCSQCAIRQWCAYFEQQIAKRKPKLASSRQR